MENCHLHVPSFILDPAHMYLCDNTFAVLCFCDGKLGSGWNLMVAAGWLRATVFSNCLSHCHWSELLLFPGVPGLPCWGAKWVLLASVLLSYRGLGASCGCPHHPELFGSLVHQTSPVCIKYHIKTLGLWLHFLFLGLRKPLASRGQETRNFRVTGSKALSCVCTIGLRVFFSSRMVLLHLKCNLKLFS